MMCSVFINNLIKGDWYDVLYHKEPVNPRCIFGSHQRLTSIWQQVRPGDISSINKAGEEAV